MAKPILAFSCCACGIILCVWGNSAFAAIGVILGFAALIGGIYFLAGYFSNRCYPLVLGGGAAAAGAAIIILCLFVDAVAYFLGGIVLAFAGIALIPVCRICFKLILPLSIALLVFGIIIIFAPSFIPWLAVLIGILLICYSHIVIIFMPPY